MHYTSVPFSWSPTMFHYWILYTVMFQSWRWTSQCLVNYWMLSLFSLFSLFSFHHILSQWLNLFFPLECSSGDLRNPGILPLGYLGCPRCTPTEEALPPKGGVRKVIGFQMYKHVQTMYKIWTFSCTIMESHTNMEILIQRDSKRTQCLSSVASRSPSIRCQWVSQVWTANPRRRSPVPRGRSSSSSAANTGEHWWTYPKSLYVNYN